MINIMNYSVTSSIDPKCLIIYIGAVELHHCLDMDKNSTSNTNKSRGNDTVLTITIDECIVDVLDQTEAHDRVMVDQPKLNSFKFSLPYHLYLFTLVSRHAQKSDMTFFSSKKVSVKVDLLPKAGFMFWGWDTYQE